MQKEMSEADVMKTIRKKEKSKKKRIILAAVGIVVVILAVNISNGVRKAGEAMQEAMVMMQTGEVSKRSLIKSVGATGKVISVNKKEISAGISNVEVASVLVEIGDTVTEGQELLYFDTADIEESLKNAKTNLNNASVRNNISAEEAARKVEDAQRNYDNQIKAAQDAIEDSEYVKVRDALYNFDSYFSSLSEVEQMAKRAELENRLKAAEPAYEAAVESYENIVETQESTLASIKNSQTTTNLSLNTNNEKNQVKLYEKQLSEGIVTAPIGGVVTAVNYEKGDTYMQGTLITIQDCGAFEVEAYIGEYDISDIEKGQKVLIKTDATGDTELEGTIVFVSPTAASTVSTGDVSYLVRISIDTPNERLRLDMSASLSIIIEQHENALTVPYNAVQEDEQGNTYVEVMEEDGTANKVPVTVVMESNYYTEIKADSLTEGQKVRIVENQSNGLFDLMGGRGGF